MNSTFFVIHLTTMSISVLFKIIDPAKKARVLQEANVIFKFCCKEGCRLLHHLDYIGVIGLTTTALRPSHLPPAVWRTGEPLETSSQDRRSHCAGGTHQHRHYAVAPNINRPKIAGRIQLFSNYRNCPNFEIVFRVIFRLKFPCCILFTCIMYLCPPKFHCSMLRFY